ncbi:tetratricopeptide repeat protein [Actinokineospora inagensis]|uniref:tetratricopeptide repeat protein n=1 Tax=Actinokineospora inagensis TaxID=103730 RepID=UPI0004290563|nr:tetratricopeptide repeat protein [Actinokineospora inagensis]
MAEPIEAVLVEAARLTAAGRPGEAVDLLRPVLVTNPDSSEAWCRLAAALLDSGDHQLSLDAAKRAITLGERSWAHRLASLALAEMGRHDEAVVSAREAARRDPGDWRSMVTLSEVLGAADPDESLAAALIAAEVAPEVPRVHEVLGLAATRVRDDNLARRAFTDALLLDPGNTEVKARLDRLPRPVTVVKSTRPARSGGFARRLGAGADWTDPGESAVPGEVVAAKTKAEPVIVPVVEPLVDTVPQAGTRPEAETSGTPEPGAARPSWTVESEWRQRMSSVWPTPVAEPEIEPVIPVTAEPVPVEPIAAEPIAEADVAADVEVQPEPKGAGVSVRPGRGEPAAARREPGGLLTGDPEPSAKRTRELPTVQDDGALPVDLGAVATQARRPGYTRSRRVTLWLILRRCAGWLTIGSFVLLVAGMPQPSPLLAWFALALVLLVGGAGWFGYRAIPAAERPTPRDLVDHVPLVAAGVVLLLLGLVMLVVWLLALAVGIAGTGLLVPTAVLGIGSSTVAWFGLWRIRTVAR